MNFPNTFDHIAAKGLYPRKDNVIFIGVTQGGERSYRIYGQLPQHIKPISAVFEMGSVTKVFTTLLLADLVQQNIVSLDDPVTRFFPDYPSVTLRQLATHTSGLPREDKVLNKRVGFNREKHLNPYAYYTPEDLTAFLTGHTLKERKSGKWNYSNIGMALLARVLEQVLGMPYTKAAEERVCRRLGMSDTVFELNEEQQDRRVEAFTKKGFPIPPLTIGGVLGAGGIHSTMGDMMRFVEWNMGLEGTDDDTKNWLHLSHQMHAKGPSKQLDQGLGWFIERSKRWEHPMIWTGGTTVGFHTYAGFIQETQTGVVVLSTYHLTMLEMIPVLFGRGPIVTRPLADEVFASHGRLA